MTVTVGALREFVANLVDAKGQPLSDDTSIDVWISDAESGGGVGAEMSFGDQELGGIGKDILVLVPYGYFLTTHAQIKNALRPFSIGHFKDAVLPLPGGRAFVKVPSLGALGPPIVTWHGWLFGNPQMGDGRYLAYELLNAPYDTSEQSGLPPPSEPAPLF